VPEPKSGCSVSVFIGGREQRFDEDDVVTLGRDPRATIRIASRVVSRQHAQLKHGPTGWELEDLGSANGTYLRGKRVASYPITAPVVISLGPPGHGVAVRIQPAEPRLVPGECSPSVELLSAPSADGSVVDPLGDDVSDQVFSKPLHSGDEGIHRVFVSYASVDAGTARSVVNHLEQQGIRCWIAERDVPVGADFAEQVVRAIDRSRMLLALVSDAANTSPHVRRELERAVGSGTKIIPLQVGDTVSSDALSYFFSGTQWLHIDADPSPESLAAVVAALRGASPGLPTRPPVPFHKVLSEGAPTVKPITHHRLATLALVCAATLVLSPIGLILALVYLASPRKNEEGRIAAWSAVLVSLSVLIVAGGALAAYLGTRG
jgi:TIR domain/FHA domain